MFQHHLPTTADTHRFIRRLGRLAALSRADEAMIRAALGRGQDRRFAPHDEVFAHKDVRRPILMEGFAYRYRDLPEGTRQILSFLVPGDTLEPLVPGSIGAMIYGVQTVRPCTFRVFSVATDPLSELAASPAVARAMWRARLQEENMLHERIVALGRRSARERLCGLFCELYTRFDAVGLVENGAVQLWLTQQEIADTIGLSNIHVNRILKSLRNERLIELDKRSLKVLDLGGLRAAGRWDPDYLLLAART